MALRIVNELGIDDLVSLGNLTPQTAENAALAPTPGEIDYLTNRFRLVLAKHGIVSAKAADVMDDVEVLIRELAWAQ